MGPALHLCISVMSKHKGSKRAKPNRTAGTMSGRRPGQTNKQLQTLSVLRKTRLLTSDNVAVLALASNPSRCHLQRRFPRGGFVVHPSREGPVCGNRKLAPSHVVDAACVFRLDGPYHVKVQTMRCTAFACRASFGPNFYTDNGSKINTANGADVKEVLFISTKGGFTVNHLRPPAPQPTGVPCVRVWQRH